jgi:hypothetical protein
MPILVSQTVVKAVLRTTAALQGMLLVGAGCWMVLFPSGVARIEALVVPQSNFLTVLHWGGTK